MSSLGAALSRVDPADSTSAYNAALKALKEGFEQEGLKLLERARRSAPGDARLWQVAGLLHRQLDEMA
ncbi:MAG TPA: hypothetical protein VEA60_07515, partial [Allosphingosinicella sp.]|nr:hypothetical protein [Allosphingosinicella sp.]